MLMPDYNGGSIVNLMASVVSALGGDPPPYPPLRVLGPAHLGSRNIVLCVIDGLGHDCLVKHAPAGHLARHLKGRITSVFPATTATAITTFLTAMAPQQHGVTGWFMYFRELGSVVAVLPFRARHGGAPLNESGVSAHALLDHAPVFDRLRARSYVVAPERIAHSEFNAAHSGRAQCRTFITLTQMFRAITQSLGESDERKYIYAYWPEFDRLAHEHGSASREALAHLAEIDAAFGEFLHGIAGTGTTVVAVADHGFIDAQPEEAVELDAHPELARMLVLPLCGERRVAYCYVHPDRREPFVDYVRTRLAEHADLYDSRGLIESGCFGHGAPHPRLHDRVGHYTLVMKRHAVIKDWLLGEPRYTHVGVHGGTSAQEMYVPLIVALT